MVKSNKIFKVIAIVLAIICIVSISSFVHADIISDMTSGISVSSPSGVSANKITGLTSNILWVIQAIGITAGIIIIAYMGIKYITSSPDGKAEIKQYAVPFTIGALVFFGATGIVSMLKTMAG